MSILSHDSKKPKTRSLALVLLAWVFIGGQALLAAGTVYGGPETEAGTAAGAMPWHLLNAGALKMRLVAAQAGPDVLRNVTIFLAVANALGVAALVCGLLSWSRSRHTSGKLTIAAAMTVILVNSLLNLPYV